MAIIVSWSFFALNKPQLLLLTDSDGGTVFSRCRPAPHDVFVKPSDSRTGAWVDLEFDIRYAELHFPEAARFMTTQLITPWTGNVNPRLALLEAKCRVL